MSESSEDKTKRKYLAVLQGAPWKFQYSVFYDQPELSVGLLAQMARFKQKLSRLYPHQPFLIRIQLRQRGSAQQAYLTMFTTAQLKDLKNVVNKAFPVAMNVLSRPLSTEKLEQAASSIQRQQPHNLTKFFSKKIVHRWSVLNKHLLVSTNDR